MLFIVQSHTVLCSVITERRHLPYFIAQTGRKHFDKGDRCYERSQTRRGLGQAFDRRRLAHGPVQAATARDVGTYRGAGAREGHWDSRCDESQQVSRFSLGRSPGQYGEGT